MRHALPRRRRQASRLSAASGAVSARSTRGPSVTRPKPGRQRRGFLRRRSSRLPGPDSSVTAAAPAAASRSGCACAAQRQHAAARPPAASAARRQPATAQCQHRMHRRHAVAPALLAGRDGDAPASAPASCRRARPRAAARCARPAAAGCWPRPARWPFPPASPCVRWPACPPPGAPARARFALDGVVRADLHAHVAAAHVLDHAPRTRRPRRRTA